MGGPRAFFDRRQNEYGFLVRKSTGLTRLARNALATADGVRALRRTGQEINMLTKRNFLYFISRVDERVTVPWERPTTGTGDKSNPIKGSLVRKLFRDGGGGTVVYVYIYIYKNKVLRKK